MDNVGNEKDCKGKEHGEVIIALLPKSDKPKESVQTGEAKLTRKAKYYRLFITIVLVGVWISAGMRIFIEFSTLPNFRLRLGTDIAELSYALSFGTFGGILATPLAACADRFGANSYIILSVSLVITAVFNAIKPYLKSIIWFAICDLLVELPYSITSAVADSLTTSMWGAKAGPPLHAVRCGFSIGLLIGPMLASVFMQNEVLQAQDSALNNSTCLFYNDTLNNSKANPISLKNDGDFEMMQDESTIEYAYLINSGFMIFLALIFLITEFANIPDMKNGMKKKSYKWKDIVSPSSWAEGNMRKGIFVFMAMNAFYVSHLGVIKGPAMLLTTYAVDKPGLNFTGSEAASLSASTGIGGLIARGLLVIISGVLNVNVILAVLIHAQLIASILLVIFGLKSKICLWIFSILFGLVTKPIWSLGFQWTNEYIILAAFHFAVSRTVNRLVDIGQNAMQGYLYTYVSIETTFYIPVVYAVLNCLALYAMLQVSSTYQKRHSMTKDVSDKSLKAKE